MSNLHKDTEALINYLLNEVEEGQGDIGCVSQSHNPAVASKYEVATEANDSPVWAIRQERDYVVVRIFGQEFQCYEYYEVITVLVTAHRPLSSDSDIKAFIETITAYCPPSMICITDNYPFQEGLPF